MVVPFQHHWFGSHGCHKPLKNNLRIGSYLVMARVFIGQILMKTLVFQVYYSVLIKNVANEEPNAGTIPATQLGLCDPQISTRIRTFSDY